jgi:hypothetical protein
MNPNDQNTNLPNNPLPPTPPTPPAPPVPQPTPPPPPQPAAPVAPQPPLPSNTFQPNDASTGAVVGGDGGLTPTPPVGTPAPTSKRRLPKKPLLIGIIALVIVLIIAGVVYAAVIVPNQPANVLKKALENTVKSPQASFSGTVNFSSSGLSTKLDLSGAKDADAKAADIQGTATVSGVPISLEARYVNKNAYIKIGDLTPVASLANSFSPDLGSLVTQVNKQTANKWISVDSTLLDESGFSCAINDSWNLTQADINVLETNYDKSQFVTIKSTSNDTVAGQAAKKFVLSLNDDKMSAYIKSLGDLPTLKNAEKCSKNETSNPLGSFSSVADHDNTPFTIWVSKSDKKIVQVNTSSTAKDKTKDDLTADATFQLKYNKVSITEPKGAVPAVQVLSNVENAIGGSGLDLSSLFGGASLGGSTDTTLTQ